MHLTKNLCVNLLGFLGVYGKPKDTLEARQDLQRLKQRAVLHPEKRDKGRHYLGPACYTLSKEEKQSMFDCLNSIKVPSGYSSNIKRLLNLKEKKLKSSHLHSTDEVMRIIIVPVGKCQALSCCLEYRRRHARLSRILRSRLR